MKYYNIDNPLTDDGRNKLNSMLKELIEEYMATGIDAAEARRIANEALTETKESKGYFENNRGVVYPLTNVIRDGVLHTVSDRVKDVILGAKVINPKKDKLYTISYVSNGYRDSYGFTIHEYDKESFSTDSEKSKKILVNYTDFRFSESVGITTRTLDLGEIIFIITIDYSAIPGVGLNLSNTSEAYALGCVIDESNYEYTIDKSGLDLNRGVVFPLKNMVFAGNQSEISQRARDALLDVKVFGAKIDCYYRLTMISNGYESGGKERWGITLEEYPKDTFETTGEKATVFLYNKETLPGNSGNALWQRQSEGIETITVDNGEIACSVTVDRSVITNSSQPLFLNFNTSHAPTAIIDPSNYFF